MTSVDTADPVVAGHAALAAGEWEDARRHFGAAAGAAGADTPDAWEGLGWAAWWLHDADLTISSRERAFRGYRERAQPRDAARVAAWVAADFVEFRGDEASARGWLLRGHRLLDGLEPGEEHAWLALHEGSLALGDEEDAGTGLRSLELAREALDIGRRLEIPDVEAIALAQEGMALVVRGEVTEGLRRLDEASAVAEGEPLRLPISAAWAFCYLVSACEEVGDFGRATRWCEAMRAFAERWRGRQILGVCRTSYGQVLATKGDWPAAENELTAAVDDLVATRPGVAGTGFVRLAELRARQGRTAEARELYERAGTHPGAIVGLGVLDLDAGDATAAREAAERVLRRLPDEHVLERLAPLELRARALAAEGPPEAAREAADAVRRVVDRLGTPYLRGRGHAIAACVASAAGEWDEARREAEDAIDAFAAGSAPYDAARARVLLAGALAALGRGERADAQARAARRVFEELGAAADLDTLDAIEHAPGPRVGAQGDLTARELDVLRLVARGLSDVEIAAELVVSPHTVHRHVANIRTKLRLPSRSAAVAYATRAGLL